jgi:hypothetical protein
LESQSHWAPANVPSAHPISFRGRSPVQSLGDWQLPPVESLDVDEGEEPEPPEQATTRAAPKRNTQA